MWFRGTVVAAASRSDGDHHLDLTPDTGYESMLDKGNNKDQNGAMVVELMPGQLFPLPQPGEHVAVFGTWVHDSHNDWNEIHPVWTVDYLGSGDVVTSLPPRIPEFECSSND